MNTDKLSINQKLSHASQLTESGARWYSQHTMQANVN